MSCDDWLEINPETNVELADQLSTAEGFKEMLNGVYIGMAQENLYGHHLMYGDIEFLAQNYYRDSNPFINFAFTNGSVISRADGYWGDLYNVIANINLILDNIDANSDLFNEGDYALLKGEALALRAFLHFDAFRLFGEPYVVASTSGNAQIPYANTAILKRHLHLGAEELFKRIFEDLDAAEALLLANDPIVEAYSGDLFDPDQRLYHFNYYAVQALKARAYLTMGDMPNAAMYAQAVLDNLNFSWATQLDFTGTGSGRKDRLLFNELVSALNVSNLELIAGRGIFDGDTYPTLVGDYNGIRRIYDVTVIETVIVDPCLPFGFSCEREETTEVDGPGIFDLRYLNQFGREESSGELANTEKYLQSSNVVTDAYNLYKIVPLIRISEMLLIAAEAQVNTDLQASKDLLDDLKTRRQVELTDYAQVATDNGITEAKVVLNEIHKEFRKETYAEGQTFFMYKRLNLLEIPAGNDLQENVTMETDNYILPLPQDERELGNR